MYFITCVQNNTILYVIVLLPVQFFRLRLQICWFWSRSKIPIEWIRLLRIIYAYVIPTFSKELFCTSLYSRHSERDLY